MTGPLLMWVAEHEPGTYQDARWALAPKDWLRARLTGEIHAEPSDASASLLYDVPGDRWDLDVVCELGLDTSLLPPLLPSGAAGRARDRRRRRGGCPRASRSRPGTRQRTPSAAASAWATSS
jgi:glycerol kinase